MSKHSRTELIEAFIAAIRASQTAVEMLDDAVADHLGLHRTAFRCLDILDQEGPMTAGRLAERARLSPGATTTVVDTLERKGLAHRMRDTVDRRRVLVEVTPEVGRMGEQLHGPYEEGVKALDVYSDEQLRFLTEYLRGSVAYQEERLRRLEAIKARDAAESG
jgi:DNA-binding MarR family transcriptional regulator